MASVLHRIRATSPAKMAIQIGHAGRKASSARPWEGGQIVGLDQGGWQTLGPSAIAHMEGETVPHELSLAQLRSMTEAFLSTVAEPTAWVLMRLSFHAAHGYLLHEFFVPNRQSTTGCLWRIARKQNALPASTLYCDASGLACAQTDGAALIGY
jgi:NADPH2 dehydrogenase